MPSKPKPSTRYRCTRKPVVASVRLLAGVTLGLLGLVALRSAEPAGLANQRIDRNAYAQGRFVFQKHCVPCHGRFGEGNGELVKDWEVLPRNFRLATFKYRSTPYGRLPTDDDLIRTIRRGVAGTAMPSFAKLRDEEIKAVLAYVKFLSPDWKDPALQGEPIVIPARPAWFTDRQQRRTQSAFGRALFRQTCAACHGLEGAGDGIAAAGLRDNQGKAIRPADLGKPLRSGPAPEDVFRTIMTGINGTPMMAFAGALQPDEVWQLAAYVMSLSESRTNPQREPPPQEKTQEGTRTLSSGTASE